LRAVLERLACREVTNDSSEAERVTKVLATGVRESFKRLKAIDWASSHDRCVSLNTAKSVDLHKDGNISNDVC
jgi:hypothetical protein